jgi:UDP-N-acetylmuramoyl-tripeptide--D-alanyl-D-alanine ligase
MASASAFKIADILPVLGGRLICGNPETLFTNYCIDSRQVESGTVFVPLMGQARDGHHYVIDSFGKGAVAALVRAGHHQIHEIVSWCHERGGRGREDVCIIEVRHTLVALQKLAEWYRLQHDVKVVGITGSVGKTGTKEMLIQVLAQKYATVGTEKNFNNEIGVPLALSRIQPDTRVAVIEMAMRARGEISLLSRIGHPDVAIITSTAGSHVGRLGSFEEVYKAKSEIVDGLVSGGTMVLNLRDPSVMSITDEVRRRYRGRDDLNLRYYDTSGVYSEAGIPPFRVPGVRAEETRGLPDPHLWVEDMELQGLDGSRFTLCTADDRQRVEMGILGRGSVENLVAASALALELGMSLADIADVAPVLLPAPQRVNLFSLPGDLYLIDDCYNSSPASAIDSLELMLNIDKGYKRILILGDMLELGKFETLLHRNLAQIALNLPFDAVYAVGPRMNAVNEVDAREDIDLYYIEGSGAYEVGNGFHGSNGSHSLGFGRETGSWNDSQGAGDQHRDSEGLILEDRAADKLSALLLDQIRQDNRPTVVLVKGSRSLHLERIVNDVLTGMDN